MAYNNWANSFASGTLNSWAEFRLAIEGMPSHWVTCEALLTGSSLTGSVLYSARRKVGALTEGLSELEEIKWDKVVSEQQQGATFVLSDIGNAVSSELFQVNETYKVQIPAKVTEAATSISWDASTIWGALFTVGEYWWIDNEAILITGKTDTSITFERAKYDSYATDHWTADTTLNNQGDTFLTKYPPSVKGRRATLYGYCEGDDLAGPGTVVYRGIVASDIMSADNTATKVGLVTDNLLSLAEGQIGTPAQSITPQGFYWPYKFPWATRIDIKSTSDQGSAIARTYTVTASGEFQDWTSLAGALNTQLIAQGIETDPSMRITAVGDVAGYGFGWKVVPQTTTFTAPVFSCLCGHIYAPYSTSPPTFLDFTGDNSMFAPWERYNTSSDTSAVTVAFPWSYPVNGRNVYFLDKKYGQNAIGIGALVDDLGPDTTRPTTTLGSNAGNYADGTAINVATDPGGPKFTYWVGNAGMTADIQPWPRAAQGFMNPNDGTRWPAYQVEPGTIQNPPNRFYFDNPIPSSIGSSAGTSLVVTSADLDAYPLPFPSTPDRSMPLVVSETTDYLGLNADDLSLDPAIAGTLSRARSILSFTATDTSHTWENWLQFSHTYGDPAPGTVSSVTSRNTALYEFLNFLVDIGPQLAPLGYVPFLTTDDIDLETIRLQSNRLMELKATAFSPDLVHSYYGTRSYKFGAKNKPKLRDILVGEAFLLGGYFCLDANKKLTLRPYELPTQGAAIVRSLTEANILGDEGQPTFKKFKSGLFNTVALNTGYNPRDQSYVNQYNEILDGAVSRNNGIQVPVDISTFSYATSLETTDTTTQAAVKEMLAAVMANNLAFLSRPYLNIDLDVQNMYNLAVGDIVSVTHTNIPDPTTGQRGVNGAVGIIQKRHLDFDTGFGTLSVVVPEILSRGWCPSLDIQSAVNDSGLTYTLTVGRHTYANLNSSFGFRDDTSYFVAGDKVLVELIDTDTQTNYQATVQDLTATTCKITFTTSAPGDLVTNPTVYRVKFDRYDQGIQSDQQNYGYAGQAQYGRPVINSFYENT